MSLKRLAISLLVMASIQVFGMSAFASTTKTKISSVDLTVTSSIQAGDEKSSSKDSVSAETDTNGVEIASVEVTNDSGSDEWKASDKPKIKVTLKTESSKYVFDEDFSKDDVDLEGMDFDSYTVKRTSNSRAYVTVTSVKLADTSTSDTSDDYNLIIESAYLDDTSGEASWDEAEDAKKYEVKLYRENSSDSDKLVDTVSTNKDYYSFASKLTSTGDYYIKVRAIYNNSHKGPYVQSASINVDSDTVDTIKENKEYSDSHSENSDTEPTASNSNSSYVGSRETDDANKEFGPSVGSYTGDTGIENQGPSPDKYTGDVYKSFGVDVISGTWGSYTDANGDTKWTFNDGERGYVNEWAYIKNPYAKPELGQESADWFRFDNDGNMVTGWWFDDNGNGFYLNPISDNTRGRMVTGLQEINGYTYYFEEESNGNRGVMYKDRSYGDYNFGSDGRAY